MKTKHILSSLAIAASLIFTGCTKSEFVGPYSGDPENIRVGFLAEVTPWGNGTNSSFDMLQVVVEDINEAGGIQGKNLELVVRDSYSDPLKAIQELHESGINFVMGPGWSSRTLAIAEYAAANNVLVMPTSATSPAISTLADNNMIWRSCVSDAFQAIVAANYIKNTMNKDKVAIIYRNDGWGTGLAESFQTNFQAEGGTVTAFIPYEAEAEDFSIVDFSDQVAELMAGQPDVILYVSFGDGATKILTDLYANDAYQSNRPDLFGVEGLGVEGLKVSLPADMVEGMRAIQAITDPDPNSNFAKFQSYVRESLPNANPGYYTACAYDNFYLLMYAMIKSGSIDDAQLIAAELKGLSGGVNGAVEVNINEFLSAKALLESRSAIDYNGASGRIEFDDNGDAGSGIFQIVKAVNGEEVEEKLIHYP